MSKIADSWRTIPACAEHPHARQDLVLGHPDARADLPERVPHQRQAGLQGVQQRAIGVVGLVVDPRGCGRRHSVSFNHAAASSAK